MSRTAIATRVSTARSVQPSLAAFRYRKSVNSARWSYSSGLTVTRCLPCAQWAGPGTEAPTTSAPVNCGALGKAIWRLCNAVDRDQAPNASCEMIAPGGEQRVRDVANRITSQVHTLSPPTLTAVSLQMAATNILADQIPGFYAACISRAEEVVPQCSLQQLADLTWAFFRAQASNTAVFHQHVTVSASSWAAAQLGELYERPFISRENAHEAANFLFRLSKAQLLTADDRLSQQMLFAVAAGVDQVPLVEIPGLLRKCRASVGADLTPISMAVTHSRDSDVPIIDRTSWIHTPHCLEFWREAVAGSTSVRPAWEEAQLLIATAAGAKASDASLEDLNMFAEQLLEQGVTADQPITVSVMEAIHRKYAGKADSLSALCHTPKQLATAMKTLAWAGLASHAVVAALSSAMCCCMLEESKELRLPPSHLVDIILQVADAGCEDRELFKVLVDAFCGHPRLHREKPKALLRMAARLAAAGVASQSVLQVLARHLENCEARGVPEPHGQEAQQAVRDIKALTFSAFSMPALKVSWNIAKGLPQPPAAVATAAISGKKLEHALAGFDRTKPLVVDLGCGLGSFARAMAVQPQGITSYAGGTSAADWNVLGLDVSPVATRRCTSMGKRDGLAHRLGFSDVDAVSGFDWLRQNYTGPIAVVHVGFPTPFPTRTAASQLEDGASSKDTTSAVHQKPEFMVQDRLVRSILQILQPDGLVLIQSNVEEVALHMVDCFTDIPDVRQMVAVKCHIGLGDSSKELFPTSPWLSDDPFAARSETEAVTMATGRKVWRSLLRAV